jgi:Lar family restriction alleviation protein
MSDLLPCPFCGGEAKREDIEARDGIENAGASYITCVRCWASTALHFDRKENLVSSWNDRYLAGVAEQSGAGAPETSVRCGAPVASNLCDDCPPVGYPTDKTRCDPCPRKACDHDWQIWPETDGQVQHCLKCRANRKTQLDIEECGNHSAGSPP